MGPIGTAALGIGSRVAESAGNLIFGGLAQKQQLKGQKKALAQSNAAQLDLWNKTNYGAQIKHMKDAGLNPALLYGMGGGGGATTGSASGHVDSAKQTSGGMGIEAMNLALLKAQKENIEADTKKKLSDATFTSGAQTDATVAGTAKTNTEIENIKQNTQNQKANEELTKAQTRLNNLNSLVVEGTMDDVIERVSYEAKIALNHLKQAETETFIKGTTKNAVVNQIVQESIGAMLRNNLTKAQTDKTRSDIHVNDAQIKEIAAKIAQGWGNLNFQIDKTKLEGMIKSIELEYPSMGETMGFLIMKALTGMQGAVENFLK